MPTLAHEEVPEDLAEVGVIRLVVEAQGTAVLEVGGELHGEALAEVLHRRGHLLFTDLLVLLLLGGRFHALQHRQVKRTACSCSQTALAVLLLSLQERQI